MTQRPVVLLDVDGVMADFVQGTLSDLEAARIPHVFDVARFIEWEILDCLELSPTDRAIAEERRRRRAGFCRGLPVYPGVHEALGELREIADVVALTAPMKRSPYWQYERTEWLQEELTFDFDDIIQTTAKHRVAGDVFVDDKPENCRAWKMADPTGIAVLWAQPYNVSSSQAVDRWIYRTNKWSCVIDLVRALLAP